MPEIFPGGLASLYGGVLSGGLGSPVVAVNSIAVGTNVYPAEVSVGYTRVTNAGLANGGTQTLKTPTAGLRLWINSIEFFAANIGVYVFKLGGVDFLYYRIIDLSTHRIEFPPFGLAHNVVNDVLAVTNNSGLGSQIEVTVFGGEY